MDEIIKTDKKLMILLNNLGSESFDNFWLMISEVWIWIPFYIILLYFLYKNYRKNSFIFILIFIILGVAISDQLANIFKYGVERLRPCHDPSMEGLIREVKCGGRFGFYSAHASNTFFLATYLFLLLKNKIKFLSSILIFWAIIVSYSRIYLGVHFPLDVLVGSFFGVAIGCFCGILAKIVIKKQDKIAENQSL